MNCQHAKALLDPYADGELEADVMLEMKQHLEGCPACATAYRNLQNLRKSLKQESLTFAAPFELRQRIKAELPAPAKAAPQRLAHNLNWNWNWLTAALSGAFAVCLAMLLLITQNRLSSSHQLAQEIVSSHVRSLMADHVMDVASTDRHTVKPWFNGKLNFSPPVKDLAAQDFSLVGGRLDYFDGHDAAALVFHRHKHVINLFIWPVKENNSKAVSEAQTQGYNLVRWIDGGMAFWAISDLNEKELMEFAQDYAAADSTVQH